MAIEIAAAHYRDRNTIEDGGGGQSDGLGLAPLGLSPLGA